MGQDGTRWDNVGQDGTTWNKMGLNATTWDNMGQHGTTWDTVGQRGTAWDTVGQRGTAWDTVGQRGTAWDSVEQRVPDVAVLQVALHLVTLHVGPPLPLVGHHALLLVQRHAGRLLEDAPRGRGAEVLPVRVAAALR